MPVAQPNILLSQGSLIAGKFSSGVSSRFFACNFQKKTLDSPQPFSFIRGFRQATRGPDTGAFHHPLFRRDQPELCLDMVCKRSRDRKPDKKNSHLPLKKRRQESNSPIAPLTKESLEAISPSEPKNSQLSAYISVSDDSRSTTSNSNSTASTNISPVSAPPVPATIPLQRGITTDASIVAAALKQREEIERLRIAKAMLYESYLKALRGE